jgi:hypothetical protein
MVAGKLAIHQLNTANFNNAMPLGWLQAGGFRIKYDLSHRFPFLITIIIRYSTQKRITKAFPSEKYMKLALQAIGLNVLPPFVHLQDKLPHRYY